MSQDPNSFPKVEPVTEPGETGEFWLDIGRPDEEDVSESQIRRDATRRVVRITRKAFGLTDSPEMPGRKVEDAFLEKEAKELTEERGGQDG